MIFGHESPNDSEESMTDVMKECNQAALAVEAFEVAISSGGKPDLADFAPKEQNPARASILAELIRVDLEYGWRSGRPIALEDYSRRFPEAFTAATLPELTFEEYRLRRDAGQDALPGDYAIRYGVDTGHWPLFPSGSIALRYGVRTRSPQNDATAVIAGPDNRKPLTHDELPATKNIRSALEQLSAPLQETLRKFGPSHPDVVERVEQLQSSFPESGTEFHGFWLGEELGRGAFGRVFLARQSDLSGRPVALKIAEDLSSESKNLAQLQHTNIMPVYSYHRAGRFQLVCMPYYGRVTLADLLASYRATETLPQSGKDLRLLVAQSSRSDHSPSRIDLIPSDPRPPIDSDWAKLEGWDYVRAMVWFGSLLAEGLAHAHARSIIHRDLKPANVLITDDGRPMLLDFNMAEDTKLRGTVESVIGGTIPYMPPEQLRAFAGRSVELDHRVDLYALGVILYELLTGQAPFPLLHYVDESSLEAMATDRERPPPSARAKNSAVSWAVDAIVRKCLAPKPDDRYQSAIELREDLVSELADRPLAFARNPSFRERTIKWFRRHPKLTSSGMVGSVAAVLLAVGLLGWWASHERNRTLEAREQFASHSAAFREAQAFADDRNNGVARSAEVQGKLFSVLDRYGLNESSDPMSFERQEGVARLEADERRRLRDDVGEAFYLLANQNLEAARFPDAVDRDRRLSVAEQWNRAAELFGDRIPRAVLRQRVVLARLRNDAASAAAAEVALQAATSDSARDHYLQSYALFRSGRYADALPGLRSATQIDPENFSAWFVRGQVHLELEQPELAALCFGSCTALRKDFAPAWLNRGLAYARLQFYDQAIEDYDRAIALRPDWAEPYLQRATVASLLGDPVVAERDLSIALACGDATPRLFFLRASVRDRLGDAIGAAADRSEGLERTPNDELSWITRGECRMATDPAGASNDVEEALRSNPLSAPALQLKAHLLAERLGRPGEAEKVLDQLVEVYPDRASFRAGRGVVLARAGKYEAARSDAREALLRDGKPPTLYQIGCIYALTSVDNRDESVEAVRLIWSAIKAGYGLDIVDTDTDLNPIRESAEFIRVVKAAKTLHEKTQR